MHSLDLMSRNRSQLEKAFSGNLSGQLLLIQYSDGHQLNELNHFINYLFTVQDLTRIADLGTAMEQLITKLVRCSNTHCAKHS